MVQELKMEDNFIKNVTLDSKEIKALSRLNGDKNFDILKRVVEQKLLQAEAFSLMIVEGEDQMTRLYYAQGAYDNWRKIKALIDRATEKQNENN